MNEDWLEQRLRSAEPHLDDDGFTLRVMAALPARRAAPASARPDWILIGATAAGSAVVAAQFPLAPFLNLILQSAQMTWIGGIVMLGCMAGALLAEPLRRAL